MSTVYEMLDEQLQEMSINPVCIIDKETRQITIPEANKFFGVENDKRVERLRFECPKEVGDENVDLMTCQALIAYENANGEPGIYEIKDMTVEGDVVHFSWLLDEEVTKYGGNVRFIFYATRIVEGNSELVWNTVPAQGFVEEGLDVATQIEQGYPAIIEALIYEVNQLKQNSGGSNNDFLVVRVDFGVNVASHSASEIRTAAQAGKIVLTMDSYGMMVPLYDSSVEAALFEALYESSGAIKKAVVSIDANKNVTSYTEVIVSAS